jgi:aminoglycoside phosphotransferase family enzyme
LFSIDTVESVVPEPGTYTIMDRKITYASRIFFIDDRGQKFCVKMWRPRNTPLYQTTDPLLRARYLLEGFYFNSQHAPGVYRGIAPIQLLLKDGESEDNARALTLFPVFTRPQKEELVPDKEYALVMLCLEDDWQLSRLLPNTLATTRGMEVLAEQIFLLHQRLSIEPQDLAVAHRVGNVAHLSRKLRLNIKLFLQSLKHLSLNKAEMARCIHIVHIISSAFIKLQHDFVRREKEHHIRRCHGDLKATNLWLYPARASMTDLLRHETQLLALDCIDFMPEFCCIDTLSDVAMLAIDIEFYTGNSSKHTEDGFLGKNLSGHFLETYLQRIQDQQHYVWPLLNYYMLEKAMIGTYGCILKYGQLEMGKRYLLLAERYARHLRRLL